MTEHPPQPPHWRRLLLTLALGLAGGSIFHYFHLPLAWVLGAMLFTSCAALLKVPVVLDTRLRGVMICALGTLLGSSFSPEMASQILGWWSGVAVSFLTLTVMMGSVILIFRNIGRYDAPTAFFCSAPGGLGPMTVIGENFGGDGKVIPLVHAIRIVLVVFVVPAYLVFGENISLPARVGPDVVSHTMSLQDMVLVVVVSLVGIVIGRAIRLPSAPLIAPMIFTAIAYMNGWATGRPPDILVVAAQVVIGSSIGARFLGLDVRALAKPILMAIVASSVMLVIAIVSAKFFSGWLGVSVPALLLSLAPGGLAEMSLIALTLKIDTAYVATLHVARILFVVLLAPVVFRLMGHREVGDGSETQSP